MYIFFAIYPFLCSKSNFFPCTMWNCYISNSYGILCISFNLLKS